MTTAITLRGINSVQCIDHVLHWEQYIFSWPGKLKSAQSTANTVCLVWQSFQHDVCCLQQNKKAETNEKSKQTSKKGNDPFYFLMTEI